MFLLVAECLYSIRDWCISSKSCTLFLCRSCTYIVYSVILPDILLGAYSLLYVFLRRGWKPWNALSSENYIKAPGEGKKYNTPRTTQTPGTPTYTKDPTKLWIRRKSPWILWSSHLPLRFLIRRSRGRAATPRRARPSKPTRPPAIWSRKTCLQWGESSVIAEYLVKLEA